MPLYPSSVDITQEAALINSATYHNSNYSAKPGDVILADTTAGNWTLTLPANPTSGNKIDVYSANDFSVNNLSINLNGQKINGLTPSALTYSSSISNVSLIYKDSTVGWIDFPHHQLTGVFGSEPTIFGSNLIAWYRADDVVQSSGSVSQWTDKSGNGNHAVQTNSILQPLYSATGFNNLPVVRFQNSKWLQMPNCLNPSWGAATLFCLYNLTDQTQQVSVMDTGNPSNQQYWSSNVQFGYASYFGEFRNNRLNGQPTNLGDAGQKLVEVVTNSSAYNIYKNSVLSYSTNPDWGVTSNPYIGRSAGGNEMNGDIAEIVLVSRDATNHERGQIEQYMKAFWGLTLY